MFAFHAGIVGGDPWYAPLFDTRSWTEADVGQSLTVASVADDADFDRAIWTLTNGIDERAAIVYSVNGGGGGTEQWQSEWLGTASDLAGSTITGFRLIVDSLAITRTGTYVGVSYQVRVEILGPDAAPAEVPEPALAFAGGVLAAACAIWRLR